MLRLYVFLEIADGVGAHEAQPLHPSQVFVDVADQAVLAGKELPVRPVDGVDRDRDSERERA